MYIYVGAVEAAPRGRYSKWKGAGILTVAQHAGRNRGGAEKEPCQQPLLDRGQRLLQAGRLKDIETAAGRYRQLQRYSQHSSTPLSYFHVTTV